MSDDHHSFSKISRFAFIMAALLTTGACASSPDKISLSDTSKPVSTKPAKTRIEPAATQSAAMQKLIQRTAVSKPQTAALAHPRPVRSQWCMYLAEDAAVEATILRAPTISGEITHTGRKKATIGYDVTNIFKAELLEAGAEAKCRRYLASTAIDKAAHAAPDLQTRSGFVAKARVISARTGKLNSLKSQIHRQLVNGTLDRSQSTKLNLAIAKILAAGAYARAEAGKRQGKLAFDMKNIEQLARQMITAERDLADIKSDLRTADAVAVNLEGGWQQGVIKSGTIVHNDAFFGGLKVSLKLGAINPQRWQHENAALKARLMAHRSEPGSVFWQLAELKKSNERARAGLSSWHRQLVIARTGARHQLANLPANDPFYLVQRYGAEIELIKLDADIASARASLNQLERNLRKLRYMGG